MKSLKHLKHTILRPNIDCDLYSKIRFNKLSLKFRYDLLKYSKEYETEMGNEMKKENLFEKIKTRGALIDTDIIQRQKNQAKPRQPKLFELNSANSVQDIKKASEIFNKYIDSLANKKNKTTNIHYYSDNNDNEIEEFIEYLNKEFMSTKEQSNMTPTIIDKSNVSRNVTPRVMTFMQRNKRNPLLKELQLFNKSESSVNGNCSGSNVNKQKIYLNFNKKLLKKRNICLLQKGKCDFTKDSANNSNSNVNRTYGICEYTHKDKKHDNDKQVKVKKVSFHFMKPIHVQYKQNNSFNIDEENSFREYNKYQEMKKLNKKMVSMYNSNKDKMNKYNMKLTSAKINFLQRNISNMIIHDANEFNNKIDKIRIKYSYTNQ